MSDMFQLVRRIIASDMLCVEPDDVETFVKDSDYPVTHNTWAKAGRIAQAVIAALPPQVSPELIEKLGKLANYLTEQGEYEACDLIDTVVERLTPKAKG